MTSYNLYTVFPQKLWKTSGTRALLCLLSLVLCCTMLVSCSLFRSSKKEAKPATDTQVATAKDQTTPAAQPAKPAPEPKKPKAFADSSLIDQGESEVKKKFGDPDVVSKSPDNLIIWTYRPKWKLFPSNADTVYVEFENGKVRKIVRAVR